MSELVFVAVPGGTTRASALLRVLVVPRLDGPTLAADGMASWPPESLRTATLEVGFATEPDAELHPVLVEPPHVGSQPGAWEAFFERIDVRPSSPARRAAPAAPHVDRTSARAEAIVATVRTGGPAEVTLDPGPAAEVTLDPASQEAYHERARARLAVHAAEEAQPVPPAPPLEQPPAEDPDFHRAVSHLREHPAVLRALGLVFELSLPRASLPEVATGVVQVRLRDGAQLPAPLPPIASPWTRFELAADRFLPASSERISAGMVALTDDRAEDGVAAGAPAWTVVTVDVDGGSRRLRDAGRAQLGAGADAERGDGPAPEPTLPALRSAGLVLVRAGREADFAARRAAAAAHAARGSVDEAVLDADDLVLGYRIDVKEFGGDWFTLNERLATYEVGELTIGEPGAPEEGHVKANAAVAGPDGALRADEVVARWSGWSLAVPRRALDVHPGRPEPGRMRALPYDFRWTHRVKPGSLLPLRFAGSYRMRARVADMAGGGLAPGDPAADRCATEAVTYRRFEPIPSPDVTLPGRAPADALGPGESVVDVVIRSDLDMDVSEFAASNPRYVPAPARALWPPRASLALAEQHGMLDDPDDEATWELVKRAMALPGEAGEPLLQDPAAGGIAAFPVPERGGLDARMTERAWRRWPDPGPKGLELEPPGAGSGPPVAFDGERLVVRLAPAEQVALELSSFIAPDFLDHLVVWDLLPKPSGESGEQSQAEQAASRGRHPMVTPARTVRLVHAVRRPRADPAGQLVREPERLPGQTWVTLAPQPAMLGVDAASTARVDLTATWTEVDDDSSTPVVDALVQSVPVERGDEELRGQLRHDLRDTRHRRIAYTATAIGRFRSFFADDEDEEAFRAAAPLGELSIPSTARPAAPGVLSVLPAFRWQDESQGGLIVRRRLGGLLRVELARPWHLTGAGEQLAVLTWPDATPPPAAVGSICEAGRDPIWETGGVPRFPSAGAFAGAAAVAAPTLAELGTTVVAAAHDVEFAGGRWHADVALPDLAAVSYCPLVRLAVARYQRESLPGLELSRAVKGDVAPLLPQRTLRVDPRAGSLLVRLEGLGPSGPRTNRVDAIVEEADAPLTGARGGEGLVALGEPSLAVPAWRPVAQQSGTLASDLAIALPPGGGARRVRVREVELVGGEEPGSQAASAGELTERTVFTDVVALP